MTRFIYILLAMFAVQVAGYAESKDATAGVQDEVPEISLITVGPGSEIYELEGHTALRINYPNGNDVAVNWGTFDFNAPNFVYRFVKGETDYSIGVCRMDDFCDAYYREGREVVEQPLNLTDAEALEIVRLVEENLRPENRTYRYNYVKDNCATRPLAVIEKALAIDSAKLIIVMPNVNTTFRKEMRNYHRNHPTYQFGIDLALGSGIDQRITNREQGFAPVYLSNMAKWSLIEDHHGHRRHLTSDMTTLVKSTEEEHAEEGLSPWFFVSITLLIATVVTRIDQRRMKVTAWFDALFYLIYGLAGALIAFLVFVSEHEATSPNINLLWLNPLCLIVPLLIWFKRTTKIVFWYQVVNLLLLVTYLVGLPFFHQSTNLLFIPLIVADMFIAGTYIYIKFHDVIKWRRHPRAPQSVSEEASKEVSEGASKEASEEVSEEVSEGNFERPSESDFKAVSEASKKPVDNSSGAAKEAPQKALNEPQEASAESPCNDGVSDHNNEQNNSTTSDDKDK